MRQRKTKDIARRIDMHYFKKPHYFRGLRRALIIVACLAAVLYVALLSVPYAPAKAGGFRAPGDQPRHAHALLHNPGPLTAAHAQFQNDCLACHGGNPASQNPELATAAWSMEVTDAHCISCHDGSIHHPNQRRFVTETSLTDDGKSRLISKDCVTCHVEHRGEHRMSGNDSANCITCHANLQPDSKEIIEIDNRITLFAAGTHPAFGRQLLKDKSKPKSPENSWVDPTVLRFNHAKHNTLTGLTDNCIACHAALDPQPGAQASTGGTLTPPYKTDKDRPLAFANSSDLRHIGEISYDAHCVSCHTVNMALPPSSKVAGAGKDAAELSPVVEPSAPTLAHEDMSLVALQIERWVDNVVFDASGKPVEIVTVPARPRPKKEPRDSTWARWATHNINDMANKVNAELATKNLTDKGKLDYLAAYADKKLELLPVPEALKGPASRPSVAFPDGQAAQPTLLLEEETLKLKKTFVQYYTAMVAVTNCGYCHAIDGDLPTLSPTKDARPLITVPTKIPDSPRRWFVNSSFDHYAHRAVNCIDCHADAWNSSKTSDVLSPDMTQRFTVSLEATDKGNRWKVHADPKHPDAKSARTTESCIDCHKQSTFFTPAAPNDCVTCHQYHDHTLERSPDGSINPATGKSLFAPLIKPSAPAAQ